MTLKDFRYIFLQYILDETVSIIEFKVGKSPLHELLLCEVYIISKDIDIISVIKIIFVCTEYAGGIRVS